jgi:hypothetical protein
LLTKKNGDFYVCGRKSLAEGVVKVLNEILTKNGNDAVKFIESMKVNFSLTPLNKILNIFSYQFYIFF